MGAVTKPDPAGRAAVSWQGAAVALFIVATTAGLWLLLNAMQP